MRILKLIGFLLLISGSIYSQNPDNVGFELGNFSYWEGYRGFCCGGSITKSGIENGWHTLMQVQGYDTNTKNTVSYIAPQGGKYSVRLGNPNAGGEAERISTSFYITQYNTLLTYMYAVVFQEADEHSYNEKPKLQIRILNAAGNPINLPCANQTIIAMPNSPGWDHNGNIYYKNWTEVSVDLKSFIGQTLTLEFTTQDCGQEGHFGYTYIDAINSSFAIYGTGCNQTNYLTLFAPAGFVKYRWYPGHETTQDIKILNPEAGDTFRVELTNECGNVYVLGKILGNISYPEVTANNDTTICLGSSITLSAHAKGNGIRYYWNCIPPHNQPTASTVTVTPAFSRTYQVYVEDDNGCVGPKSTATVKVTVDRHLYFNLGPDITVCPDTLLNFTSPLKCSNYLWTLNTNPVYSSLDSSIAYRAFQCTTVNLKLTDSVCSFSSIVHIIVPPRNLIVPFCEHDTLVKISATKAKEHYWVQTGDTSQLLSVFNPKDGDRYTVIMKAAEGCYDSMNYYLSREMIPISYVMADRTICLGESITLHGIGGAKCYWYSNPPGFYSTNTDETIIPYTTRSYYYVAQSKHGCRADSVPSVLITVKTDAYFKFNFNKNTFCFGDTVTIKPNISQGTFNWRADPPGLTSTDSLIKVIITKPSRYILIHELNGCKYADDYSVNIYPRPDVKILDYCGNDTFIEIVPKIIFSRYLWLPMHDTNHSLKIKSPPILKKVWLSYSIMGGCSDTQEYAFNKIPNPKIFSLPDTSICDGDSIQFYVKGGKSYYHYNWYNENDSLFSNNKNPLVWPNQKTKYKIIVTNEIKCYGPESIDSFTISLDTSAITDLGKDTFICKGSPLSLTPIKGTGVSKWTSDPPGFNSNTHSVVVTPKVPTKYFLQMKNGKCWGNKADIIVNIWDLPLINAGQDKRICIDSELVLAVDYKSIYKYKWWSNQSSFISNQADILVKPKSTTIYYIDVTDTNGCLNKDTIKVNVQTRPVIKFAELIVICKNISYRLNAFNQNCRYHWSTGDTSSSILIKQPGIYRVIVDNNGCIQEAQTQIEWIPQKDTLIIPNIFTPNNDGINDLYKITTDNFEYFDLKIYNRWGLQIFSCYHPDYLWKGTIHDLPASPGVYYYILDIKSNCEEAKSYSGTITLER